MQYIYTYDDIAKKIENLADNYDVSEAEIIEGFVDALEYGAFDLGDFI